LLIAGGLLSAAVIRNPAPVSRAPVSDRHHLCVVDGAPLQAPPPLPEALRPEDAGGTADAATDRSS
ncbi:MAG: hypothetical protein JWO57_4277, partial [Pseudonocardiales bacterium]|nr:hypothetical protein [Pseudonocardiales bacterium]